MNNCSATKKYIAVGYFDGVHLGHQKVLREAVRCSENHGSPAVVTFDMSDSRSSQKDSSDILPVNERIDLLKKYGIKEVIVLPFGDVRAMNGEEFVETVLRKECNGAAVYTGEDFRFGANRSCGAGEMALFCKKYQMASHIVSEVVIEEERVSSSEIRKALSLGNIVKVNRFLGRKYGFTLPVFHDKHLASQLGFPTINQRFPENIVVPRKGVYCSEIELDGINYRGVTNLGIRPTVGGDKVTIETHILNFSGDLYGKEIKVNLIDFIRDEKSFDSIEKLKEAIKADINTVSSLNID